MLDAKQAISKALEFSAELSSSLLPTQNVLLEGIEATDDEKWLVTLSFAVPVNREVDDRLSQMGPLGAVERLERIRKAQRIYRQFRVDGQDGKVLSMKPTQVNW